MARYFTRFVELLLVSLCLSLVACSARPVVPVGEIPQVPPPSSEQIKTARALIEGEMGVPVEAMQVKTGRHTGAKDSR